MRLCFSGLERQIELFQGGVTTLEVHNRVLFGRLCQSLVAETGDLAPEPYVLCDDDGALINERNRFLVVHSPLDLPWGNRMLGGAICQRMTELIAENPDGADSLKLLARQINSALSDVALQLQSDYSFTSGWDVCSYLKAFAFGVERDLEDSTLDSCMKFLSLSQDVGLEKVLVFLNLKLFLSEHEFFQVLERCFLSSLRVLLLETVPDAHVWDHELKYVVDQHFLER